MDKTYFYSKIDNSNIKKSTKDAYKRNLNKALQIFENDSIQEIIEQPESFENKLKKYKINKGYGNTFCCNIIGGILSLFNSSSEIRESNKENFEKFQNMHDLYKKTIKEHYKNGDMTEKQKKGFVSFDEIVQKRDELEDGSIEKLILSMYSMIAPKRADFYNCRIYKTQPKTPKTNNYMVINKKTKKLYLNEYKTSDIYGCIVEELPDELVYQIQKSLENKPRQHLFVGNHNKPFSSNQVFDLYLNKQLKKIFQNEYISLNTLRHAYIIANRPSTDNEREALSKQMGHQVSTQEDYLHNI